MNASATSHKIKPDYYSSGESWKKSSFPMPKVIFKSLHMDDYKVVEEEAEHTSMLVTGRDPKSHTAPLNSLCSGLPRPTPTFPLLLVLSMTTPLMKITVRTAPFSHKNTTMRKHSSEENRYDSWQDVQKALQKILLPEHEPLRSASC